MRKQVEKAAKYGKITINNQELTGERAWYIQNAYTLWSRAYTFMGTSATSGVPTAYANTTNMANIQMGYMRPQMMENTLYATAAQDVSSLVEFKNWAENSIDSETSKDIKNKLIDCLGLRSGGGLVRYMGLPTVIEAAIGQITTKKRQVSVTANDRESKQVRLQQENKQKGAQLLAQKLPQEIQGLLPQQQKDWALESERVLQKGVNAVSNQENDPLEIDTRMNWWGINGAIYGAKHEVTPDNGIEMRAVDMLQAVIAMPTRMNCEDLQAMGEVRFMTIAELKRYDTKHEYTEQEWASINNIGSIGYTFPNNFGTQNDKRVAVLDCEFIADEEDTYRQTKFGTFPVESNYVAKDPKSKVIKDEYCCLYKCLWVINSNMVLYYGKVPFQTRGAKGTKNFKKPDFSYDFYCPYIRSAGQKITSLVARVVRTIDKMQICMLNFLYELAMANPSGYIYDLDAMAKLAAALGGMESTGANGEEVISDPFIALNMARLGVHINIRDKNAAPGSQSKVMTERVEGGISNSAMSYLEAYLRFKEEINDLLGIPKGGDGTLPNADQPVRTQQAAQSSSLNLLSQISNGVDKIWESKYKKIARIIPQIFAEKKLGGIKSTVLSDFYTDEEEELLAKMGIALTGQYEFNVKKSPTAIELQEFSANLDIAVANQMIGIGDKLRFMNIAQDDIQMAVEELKAVEAARMNAANEQQIAVQKENGAQQLAAVEAAAKAKLEEIKAQGEADIAVERVKGEEQRLTMGVKVEGDNKTQVETADIKTQGMIDSQHLKDRNAEIIADKQMEHEKEISAREKLHETVMSERDKEHEKEESEKERQAEKDKPVTKTK